MSLVKKAVLAAGLVMLAFLLWQLDPAETLAMTLQVGWLFVPILFQELGAHLFNAWAWRCAFRPEHAASFSLRDLLRYRVMGDGVNYLTPSATIAGEFARASLLSDSQPMAVRVNGVVAAKFAQGLAQVLFICVGLGWAFGGAVPAVAPYESPARAALAVCAVGAVGVWLWPRGRRRVQAGPAAGRPGWRGWVSRLPGDLLALLADHPLRSAASVVLFAGGYAWNLGEAWLIARALGVPIDLTTALRIEVLSNVIDALLFMVPAKVGTQEAGKTLVFGLLGLPPRAGLAFGLVRHARELAWAGLGLGAYAAHERALKALRETVTPA
ncbi:MAG: flippase-like domain-containing protein [Elusimicrobia bacterium]|nr:flippase-like domain-containing protein [Elusimicrobiota bacterium]